MKVPDGLKYHIIDIWVDELDKVDMEGELADDDVELMIGPLRKVESKGWTKTVRGRAREALEDRRLKNWRDRHKESSEGSDVGSENHIGVEEMVDDEEWGGIED